MCKFAMSFSIRVGLLGAKQVDNLHLCAYLQKIHQSKFMFCKDDLLSTLTKYLQ
jgi:hypothetical protein